MNKNVNSDDDDYYEQLNFLKNNSESNEEKSVKMGHTQGTKIRGAITTDQMRNSNVEFTSGVKSVMEEEEPNVGDSLIMRKTEGQRMIESPELNKKMRTQIDYREAKKGNQATKKNIQDEITFNKTNVEYMLTNEEKNKLIYKEMKKSQLEMEKIENKEIKEDDKIHLIEKDQDNIKNPSRNIDKIDSTAPGLINSNMNDSKLKVYRVKKKKIVSDENTQDKQVLEKEQELRTENKTQLPKQDNTKTETFITRTNPIIQYSKFTPYLLSSSLFIVGGIFLLKFYKKYKK